jgi:surface protein
MFSYATQFDAQSFNADLSNWDVSSVTDMKGAFYNAKSFDSAIGAWDVSKVKTMYRMFAFASRFNSEIGAWDTSQVQTMGSMFESAASFNDPSIAAWDVQSATNFRYMFSSATQFDADISPWALDVASLSYTYNDPLQSLFAASAFSYELCWDVGDLSTYYMFESTTGSLNTRAAKCACSVGEFYNGSTCEVCAPGTVSFGKTESCMSCTNTLCPPTSAPTVSPPPTISLMPTIYKTPINDENFYTALNAWFYDEDDAEIEYGHISGIYVLTSSVPCNAYCSLFYEIHV